MEAEGMTGLSPAEYKQGVEDRKALKEIQLKYLYMRYVEEEDLEIFKTLTQVEQQNYIANRMPQTTGDKDEALANSIKAANILREINEVKTEIVALLIELDKLGEEAAMKINKDVVAFLRPYLANSEQILELMELPIEERINYLKTHLPHTPDTTDEQLEEAATSLSRKVWAIEENTKAPIEEEAEKVEEISE